MLNFSRNALTIALVALGSTACQESAAPVGTLRAEPGELTLGFPEYQELEISFEALTDLEAGATPMVMVHLLDASGTVVRTFDHPLPGSWKAGSTHGYTIELYQSALAPPLDPGDYRLTMGLFDPERGRWALDAPGDDVGGQEYVVASVQADSGSQGAPKLFYSPSWQATEAGTDVQILGRRWLHGAGEIRIASTRDPGTVRLHFRIPAPDPQVEDLVLSEGYDEIQLDVTSTCDDQARTFTGRGTHIVEVPVGPEADCVVQLVPHYQIVTRRNLEGRALALDLLAWRAD